MQQATQDHDPMHLALPIVVHKHSCSVHPVILLCSGSHSHQFLCISILVATCRAPDTYTCPYRATRTDVTWTLADQETFGLRTQPGPSGRNCKRKIHNWKHRQHRCPPRRTCQFASYTYKTRCMQPAVLDRNKNRRFGHCLFRFYRLRCPPPPQGSGYPTRVGQQIILLAGIGMSQLRV